LNSKEKKRNSYSNEEKKNEARKQTRIRLNHSESNQVEAVAVVVVLEEDIVDQHYQHIDKHV